jgi:GT2 family glycosyltransferase
LSCAVVIVNWNGAQDTLECLRSLRDQGAQDQGLGFIVVDTGSSAGSLERIVSGLKADGVAVLAAALATPPTALPAGTVCLLAAGENLGFAAGANAGLRAASGLGFERVCFLNNDTVVEPGALPLLLQRLQADARCFATLPMLTVHGSERIWNCGGEAWPIGLRRYHLAGRPRAEGARRGEIRCSFFTGCCFVVRTDEFMARGGFSERFFFGEEDFELGLWLRERGLHAVCVTSAVVQHKVSASFGASASAAARAFVYYLNRFIHMRLRLGRWRWGLWCAAYLPYVVLLLGRRRVLPAAALPGFVRRLLARAAVMDGVGRADFEAVMAGRW